MTRFFVKTEELLSDSVILSGDNAAHARVLRLRAGEEVIVSDGSGTECLCAVETVSDTCLLSVKERRASETEACAEVRVYMAFSKSDKFEHVIQKATELGAKEIVAFSSERCVSKPDEKSLRKKQERWQKIALSAAEQSGRGIVPAVRTLPNFAAVLCEVQAADLSILFYENEEGLTLTKALKSAKTLSSVALITGPEGGLAEKEVASARDAGVSVCTLGKRILRCETAPLCALSAVMFYLGEF